MLETYIDITDKTLVELTKRHIKDKKFENALVTVGSLIDHRRERYGAKSIKFAKALETYGNVCTRLDMLGAASRYYEDAVTIILGCKTRDDLGIAELLSKLGITYFALNEYEKANENLEQALVSYKFCKGPDSQEVAVTRFFIAKNLMKQHEYGRAYGYLQRVRSISGQYDYEVRLSLRECENSIPLLAEQARTERASLDWESV